MSPSCLRYGVKCRLWRKPEGAESSWQERFIHLQTLYIYSWELARCLISCVCVCVCVCCCCCCCCCLIESLVISFFKFIYLFLCCFQCWAGSQRGTCWRQSRVWSSRRYRRLLQGLPLLTWKPPFFVSLYSEFLGEKNLVGPIWAGHSINTAPWNHCMWGGGICVWGGLGEGALFPEKGGWTDYPLCVRSSSEVCGPAFPF